RGLPQPDRYPARRIPRVNDRRLCTRPGPRLDRDPPAAGSPSTVLMIGPEAVWGEAPLRAAWGRAWSGARGLWGQRASPRGLRTRGLADWQMADHTRVQAALL